MIVELGTMAGFQLVLEARDLMSRLSEFSKNPDSVPESIKKHLGEIPSNLEGHVFAPVSH